MGVNGKTNFCTKSEISPEWNDLDSRFENFLRPSINYQRSKYTKGTGPIYLLFTGKNRLKKY